MQQADVPLNSLFVSDLNARKDLQAGQEDSGIAELAASIRQKGLLSPLIVRSAPDGRYEVVIGQRRLLACQQVMLDPVPCLVRDDIDDTDAVALSLVENVHRADMHPLDKARALKALYDRYGSYEGVAKETAWSASTIRKYVQLLALPMELQERISTTEGPAKVSALAKLATHFSGEEAIEVYEKISGFRQSIQEQIIKKSEGDISRVDELVEEAQEGAFDVRHCGGRFRCEIIRDIIQGSVSQADFQQLVSEVAENLGSEMSKVSLRGAARDFWKALAKA
jgi:ParB family chromosome partitioning protein